MAECAARYASKTRQKGQKTADLDQKNLLIVYQNYIYCAVKMLKSLKAFVRISILYYNFYIYCRKSHESFQTPLVAELMILVRRTQMVHFSSEIAWKIISNITNIVILCL